MGFTKRLHIAFGYDTRFLRAFSCQYDLNTWCCYVHCMSWQPGAYPDCIVQVGSLAVLQPHQCGVDISRLRANLRPVLHRSDRALISVLGMRGTACGFHAAKS